MMEINFKSSSGTSSSNWTTKTSLLEVTISANTSFLGTLMLLAMERNTQLSLSMTWLKKMLVSLAPMLNSSWLTKTRHLKTSLLLTSSRLETKPSMTSNGNRRLMSIWLLISLILSIWQMLLGTQAERLTTLVLSLSIISER